MKKIEGIIPVMLTPFTDDNVVDYPGLGNLIDWYIANGADALFAVCQSSEMQFLRWKSASNWRNLSSIIRKSGFRSSLQGIFPTIWTRRLPSFRRWRKPALMHWC